MRRHLNADAINMNAKYITIPTTPHLNHNLADLSRPAEKYWMHQRFTIAKTKKTTVLKRDKRYCRIKFENDVKGYQRTYTDYHNTWVGCFSTPS